MHTLWNPEPCSKLVRFLLLWSNSMTKSNWEGKGLFQPPLPYNSLSSKEVRAGTWSQEMKQRPWRNIALLSMACSTYFFTHPGNYLRRDSTTHSCLDPSTSIINQENITTDLYTGQSYQSIFSLKVPHSQIGLGSCQVDIKTTSTCT